MNKDLNLNTNITVYSQDWETQIQYIIVFNKKGSIKLSYPKNTYRGLLSDLYVNEGCRNQGIGSTLIESAEIIAKDAGLLFIQLACTLKNKKLLQWYINKGYSYSGESEREDYIYLQKIL